MKYRSVWKGRLGSSADCDFDCHQALSEPYECSTEAQLVFCRDCLALALQSDNGHLQITKWIYQFVKFRSVRFPMVDICRSKRTSGRSCR